MNADHVVLELRQEQIEVGRALSPAARRSFKVMQSAQS